MDDRMTTRRAIGIVRVSDRGEREEAAFHSPADQRAAIETLCAERGWRLLDCHEEINVSGGALLEDRPGLSRAVTAVLTGGADAIVALDASRLWRSVEVRNQALRLVEGAGGQVWTAKDGKVSNGRAREKFAGNVTTGADEMYREEVAEKTADAQKAAAAKGIPPIILPPGLARDGDRIVLTDDAPAVAEAVRLRAGGATVKTVRDHLRAHGISGRQGKALSSHGAQTILRSPLLTGRWTFGKGRPAEDRLSGTLPVVVDRDIWERAQRVRVPRGPRAKSDRLLARAGILRCASCGARMVVGSANHGAYPLYRCPPNGDCEARVTIAAEPVERYLTEIFLSGVRAIVAKGTDISNIAELADALAQAQAALDGAIAAFTGLETEPAAIERLADLRADRDRARNEYEQAREAQALPSLSLSLIDKWPDLTVDERRKLLAAGIEAVTVKRGRAPVAERVTVRWRG